MQWILKVRLSTCRSLCPLLYCTSAASIGHKSPEPSKRFHNETCMTHAHCRTKANKTVLGKTQWSNKTWEEMAARVRMRLQETEKLYRVNWTKQRRLPTRREQWERHLFWSCSRNYQALLLSSCQSIPLHIIPHTRSFSTIHLFFTQRKTMHCGFIWLKSIAFMSVIPRSRPSPQKKFNTSNHFLKDCPEHRRCECVALSVLRCPN